MRDVEDHETSLDTELLGCINKLITNFVDGDEWRPIDAGPLPLLPPQTLGPLAKCLAMLRCYLHRYGLGPVERTLDSSPGQIVLDAPLVRLSRELTRQKPPRRSGGLNQSSQGAQRASLMVS